MNPTWSCALFDLDGTIIDSAPGITATLAWVFEQLDRPIPTPVELLDWVGPPILDSFRDRAGMSPAQSQRALEMYRPRYLEMGLFDSAVYPGVAEVLRGVAESPLPLALATSKPELAAITALEHYGLADYFDVITGASEDEVRSSKTDVVGEALVRLAAIGADVSRPVLVGDRDYDVEGAGVHGVPTIFAEWGYGSPAEAAGAIAIARSMAELKTLLLG